jgi:outer membrane receptor protein involved in Fe transport
MNRQIVKDHLRVKRLFILTGIGHDGYDATRRRGAKNMKRLTAIPWVILLLSSAVAAQEEDLEVEFFFDEAETVTSAARHRQQIGMSPSAITVITRKDIETSGATNFTDLFRMVPGLGVLHAAPMLGAVVGRLIWANENFYFLVLIDGREANIDLFGIPMLEVEPIYLDDVERIEIIRGPASALYGANAFAGVISITTRAIREKTSGWAHLSGGDAGWITAQARASTRIGDWGMSISGGAERMGFYTDPETLGKRVWKVRAVAEHRWSETRRLVLDAGVSAGRGPVTTLGGTLDSNVPLRTLRLAYQSDDLSGQLYWKWSTPRMTSDLPVEFGGVVLARGVPVDANVHNLDGEIQYSLPRIWEPLLLIAGAGGRYSWVQSDHMLDAVTFSDPNSPNYHQPGIEYWEIRAGAFAHAEYQPVDWLTVTAGVRLDYNTETDFFLSPRLAAVLRPVQNHFFRLSAARSFRKPAFTEARMHLMAEFPDESPIQGGDQVKFLEFATRVQGNDRLGNETLLAVEAGYLGYFLDGRLRLAVDLYFNQWANEIKIDPQIVLTGEGLPDLDRSSVMMINIGELSDIAGVEFSVRYDLTDRLSLTAFWDHRQTFDHDTGESIDRSPKNLFGLGGRFRTESGFLGSLYVFARSAFVDRGVQNPAGLLEPSLVQDMPDVLLFLGRLGWAWQAASGLELEVGARLFLPNSPFAYPYYRYREEGGGVTPTGHYFGGVELARMITGYLQGSF